MSEGKKSVLIVMILSLTDNTVFLNLNLNTVGGLCRCVRHKQLTSGCGTPVPLVLVLTLAVHGPPVGLRPVTHALVEAVVGSSLARGYTDTRQQE